MHNTEANEQIVKEFYHNMVTGDVDGALGLLDKYVIWVEPGAPDVPFGGVYNGLSGIMDMLKTEHKDVQLKGLIPKNYFSAENLVVVLGTDTTTVLSTTKTYTTDWAMFFTIAYGKITMVQTYMDTNAIAKAFLP